MIKITGVSYSVQNNHADKESWILCLLNEIKGLIQNGSDIIVYPELFLLDLEDYFKMYDLDQRHEKISDFINSDLLPLIKENLKQTNVLLVLGSGPIKRGTYLFNSSPIFINGDWIFQDKIYLTPWENCFHSGEEIKIFEFKKMKIAISICFDIEQPFLSQKLKEEKIDVLLCPSATTNKNGNQRVNRCASARSVELGAVVLSVPVVGNSTCDLIDHNEGRQGFFLPAQEDINISQEQFSTYSFGDHVVQSYEFNEDLIISLKKMTYETKPFLKSDPLKLKITRL